MVIIRQNRGAKIILHAKLPTFRAARLKSFTGLSARVPECQKINNGGLDQYGAERFGLVFATIRKSVGLKGLSQLELLANMRTL